VKARDGGAAPAFDFLAAMRESEGGNAAQRRALYWWAGVAALLIFNFALLTWRDASSLAELRQAVESQGAPVAVAMRTRDRVGREAMRRAQLLDAQATLSALPVLDAVTAAMPQDAWVRRFEWNGRSVHIIGARKTSADILARLEASPYLRNAKSLSSDGRPDAQGYQAFEMTAEREYPKERIASAAPLEPQPAAPRPGAPGPRPVVHPMGAIPKPVTAAPKGAGAADDSSDDDDDDTGDTAAPNPHALPPPLRPGFRRPGFPTPLHPIPGRPVPGQQPQQGTPHQ
jgi:hypothetical protein